MTAIIMNTLNSFIVNNASDFLWSLLVIVAVVVVASFFVEKPTRPIQWDDEVNGDASLLGRNGHE